MATRPESRLAQAIRILVRAEEAFGALTLVAIVVIVSLQIAGRYVITSPLVWTDEVARLFLVWMTFVGATHVMAHAEHITIVMFEKRFSETGRKVINTLAMVIVVGTCLAFLPGTIAVAVDTQDVTSPALGFSKSLIYAAAVTGFTLIAVHAVLRIVEIVTGRTYHPETLEESSIGAV